MFPGEDTWMPGWVVSAKGRVMPDVKRLVVGLREWDGPAGHEKLPRCRGNGLGNTRGGAAAGAAFWGRSLVSEAKIGFHPIFWLKAAIPPP